MNTVFRWQNSRVAARPAEPPHSSHALQKHLGGAHRDGPLTLGALSAATHDL
ncbi:hypothetical protein AB0F96_31035 [Streptomyces sp. NPDC023998]|uniref:hypothetical protein n=1 Tax=Streptomyces sp. NPDC023998 TaxID=3154597 RepID=UPI0033F22DF3